MTPGWHASCCSTSTTGKNDSTMNYLRLAAHRLALAVAFATLPVTATAADELPEVRQNGGVAYLSGGETPASRAEALRRGREMNLELSFSRVPSGMPVSDVAVSVADSGGDTVLALASADALPLARVEPGRYRLSASVHGQVQQRIIDVPAQGRRVERFELARLTRADAAPAARTARRWHRAIRASGDLAAGRSTDRRLRVDRRLPLGGAGVARRLDRLVLPAALRLRQLLRPPARPERRWPFRDRAARAARRAGASTSATASCWRPPSSRRSGALRLTDFFAMRRGGREHPRRELVRIVEGLRGSMRAALVEFVPRFDYGEIKPWIYRVGDGRALRGRQQCRPAGVRRRRAAAGRRARPVRRHRAARRRAAAAGDAASCRPKSCTPTPSRSARTRDAARGHLDETLAWWHEWASKLAMPTARPGVCIVRSAIVLKALTFAPTGAIIAAPTTSLPEHVGGERNWDYRYSWIRDSVFTVRALANLGCVGEADGFRRFIQRSAAGNARSAAGAGRRRRQAPPDRDRRSITWKAGAARGRCASATPPTSSSRPTCSACCSSWPAAGARAATCPTSTTGTSSSQTVDAALEQVAPAGSRHLGGARRAAPLRALEGRCAGSRCSAASSSRSAHGLPAPIERWSAARDEIRDAVETQRHRSPARQLRRQLRRTRRRRGAAVAARCRLRRVRRPAHAAHRAGDPRASSTTAA